MSQLLSLFSSLPVVTDGAWGTEFLKRGLAPGDPADLWNLSRPADVLAVARAYVEAGSQVILTNTFRSNPVTLAHFGDVDKAFEINKRGVEISLQAADGKAKVFASIGPTGKLLSAGEIDEAAAIDAFRIQSEAAAAGGAHALIFETFSDVDEARVAVRAAKPTGLPIIVSFAFDAGKNKDRTMTGKTPEAVGAAMAEEGADAVGANCGAGPDVFAKVCERLKAASGLPVWIKPNAGLPVIVEGRATYAMSPAEFATFIPAIVSAGAAFIGGCCGTNPEFIRATKEALGKCACS